VAVQTRDLREQLAPINARLREGYSLIRPVSQVTIRLKQMAGRDRFALTIDNILRWMNNRAGRRLPDSAWQRKSFELSDIGAQRTAAVALEDPPYWAARLDDADRNVPLRTWISELGVGTEPNNDVLFGARLICATRGEDPPFDRSIPGFVREILKTGPAELDGQPLHPEPILITTEAGVDDLVELLERGDRAADVIVFSLPDGSADPKSTIASAGDVHRSTQGAAHVFVLSGAASFYLTDRVGKELSVFWQAIRTYRPAFKCWVDDPWRHPLALPQRIATWNEEGPSAFVRWLVNQTLAGSVRDPDREQRLPGFNTVRQLVAGEERKRLKHSGGSDAELTKMYEQDNEQLRKELTEQKDQYDGLLASADLEREAAVQEANSARAQTSALRERVRLLEKRLPSQSQTPIPDTLNDFESWCQEYLMGSVEIINRAFYGVRKSVYHEPSLIYKALLLLRDKYSPMRIHRGVERKKAYDAALAELQIEDSASGEGIRFDADQYSVQYAGRRRALDRHLKKGSARNPRYCFRLYFFWDDEAEVAVVGWLPSHLDNSMT
jgi:hypothetical protein